MIETLEMGLKVGGWLTGFTVTVNVRVVMLFVMSPLLTVTVTVAVPNALVTGANVSVPVLLGLV